MSNPIHDAVRSLHAEGKSYQEIADELGRTRNSISGLCRRLGLRSGKVRGNFRHHRGKRRVVVPPVQPLNFTTAQLSRESCRYVYGERGSFTFCGHETCGGSYCPYHAGLVYRRVAA